METNNRQLISDLSTEYADRMCKGDDDRQFSRSALAAAYVVGAEATLTRACNIIRESAAMGGLSPRQSDILLRIINDIESKPKVS